MDLTFSSVKAPSTSFFMNGIPFSGFSPLSLPIIGGRQRFASDKYEQPFIF
jgi:hypothetical protein